MIVCDRCKKPARPFCFGDAIHEDYQVLDLCPDCAKSLSDLLWQYRKGRELVAITRPVSDFSEDK